jgi:hypothetical protein
LTLPGKVAAMASNAAVVMAMRIIAGSSGFIARCAALP